MKWNVIVIGAGAAGMLAAGKAAEQGMKVLLLEKNEKAGRKIAITGKGRCNVTNECDKRTFMENTITNSRFLYSALEEIDPQGIMALLESYKVPLKTERGQRVFPVSDRSFDIIDGLLRFVKDKGVQIAYGVNVETLEPIRQGELSGDGGFRIGAALSGGSHQTYEADSVILATGGLSYPTTGSTGDGHRLAEEMGLEVTELRPGLIPFTIEESFCKDLMGLSLKNVRVRITATTPEGIKMAKKKPLYDDMGEMLFTHFGVSGPLILTASSTMQAWNRKKKTSYEEQHYQIHIDLKPALDEVEMDKRLLKDIEKYKAREFRNSLEDLLPRKMIPVIVKLSGIDPTKKMGDLSKEERKTLGSLLKDMTMTITGTRPIEEAIVTMGGVSVKEIDPSSMMVKTIPGLFMAGEMLDIDAFTGGFNLQIAFSTGALAGRGAAEYVREKE